MSSRANVQIVTSTSALEWRKAWPDRLREAKAVIRRAAAAVPVHRSGLVEIEFTSDDAVRSLNRQFRGQDKPTNVLSFPNPSAPFGSIALAYPTIAAEAFAQRKRFSFHANHLVLHGFLHLIGFDHVSVTDRRLMERLETRILGGMGIPNPYLLAK